jgi:hypothetical protein
MTCGNVVTNSAAIGLSVWPVFYGVAFGNIPDQNMIHANVGVKCYCASPETETSSLYWAQLTMFYLKTETQSSPKRIVLNKLQDDE